MTDMNGVQIIRGGLIRDTETGLIYRVLYVSAETVCWIRMDESRNIPESIAAADLKMKLKTGSCEGVLDPVIDLEKSAISPARAAERDRIYELIKDIVTAEPGVYRRRERSALLRAKVSAAGIGISKLYTYLGRYWRGGMTPNALLPRFNERGSKEQVYTDKRPGRQRQDGQSGKILTDADKKNFARAIREYRSFGTATLTDTYNWMIFRMYVKPRFPGDPSPERLPPEETPSFRQFSYWYSKNRQPANTQLPEEQRMKDPDSAECECRGAAEDISFNADWAGMAAQIDAMIASCYLVRERNRNVILGRPVLFFIRDVKTSMITGMHITLENTAWSGALLALKNAAEPKAAFCKRYGVEIADEEWPCQSLPTAIISADEENDEMEESGFSEAVARLGIVVENAPSYRSKGDLREIMESALKTINMKLTGIVPGAALGTDREKDIRARKKEACIDVRTFIGMIIRCVLFHNNYHVLKNYERSSQMIRMRISPVPRDLWNYGIRYQSGTPRTVPWHDIVTVLFLKDSAEVTDSGICFRGLYYTCEKPDPEKLFRKAGSAPEKQSRQLLAYYDPACLDSIYASSADGALIRCRLRNDCSSFAGMSEAEVNDLMEQDRHDQYKAELDEVMANAVLEQELQKQIAERLNDKKSGGTAARKPAPAMPSEDRLLRSYAAVSDEIDKMLKEAGG
ncbi:MAG: hypothetical protein VZR11_09865 [Succinimonas sp.]|nr:hypothetical protein [Succinimonas sp.]